MNEPCFVHLDNRPYCSYVVELDDNVWPVVCMYDENGEETYNIDDACSVTAGRGAYWLTIELGDVKRKQ